MRTWPFHLIQQSLPCEESSTTGHPLVAPHIITNFAAGSCKRFPITYCFVVCRLFLAALLDALGASVQRASAAGLGHQLFFRLLVCKGSVYNTALSGGMGEFLSHTSLLLLTKSHVVLVRLLVLLLRSLQGLRLAA